MSMTERAHDRSPSDASLSSCRSSHTPSPPRLAVQLHQLQSVQNNELVAVTVPAAGDIGGEVDGGGGERRRTEREAEVGIVVRGGRMSGGGGLKKLALGFRLFGLAFCLVSLSLMAADRNMGWALDSFNRYIEFRYCMVVNVIGFAYSTLQGINLAYQLSFGKYISESHVCCLIDFAFDQMVAYLLISSSSTAAIRVDDWRSNWGKDKFPDMASASVTVSFMSFVSFASSSLISGYTLCTL